MSRKTFLVFLSLAICTILAWQTASATWVDTTALPYRMQMGGCIAYNGYLYYVSGNSPDAPGSSIEVFYAPIASDGTVGAWLTTSQLPMDQTYIHDAVCIHNNFMYSPSGWSYANSLYANVYYAAINPDGTLGSWLDAGALPLYIGGTVTGTDCHAARIYNGKLYIIGGENSPSFFDEIYFCTLQGDGSLGTWNTSSRLPKPLWFMTVEMIDGYMYVFGGLDGSTASTAIDTIYSAPVNLDGSIGTWTQQTVTLPQPIYCQASCAVGNKVYLLGGRNPSAEGLDVFWCATVSAGTVTGVEVLTPYPATTTYPTAGTLWYNTMCAVPASGRVYVPGGRTGVNNASALYLSDVRFWQPPATPTPTPAGFTGVEGTDWMHYE